MEDLVPQIQPGTDSGNWTLAVVEVLPSEVGLVRKLIIRTKGKNYTWPIMKLTALNLHNNENKTLWDTN
jgi:hypothetical protein